MPITSVTSDPAALTLTASGEYPVPVERLWRAFADPRQIERFWGPPTWPATFSRHDMVAGGESHYRMTGPEGTVTRGFWHFTRVEAPHRFEVRDGFADEVGAPDPAMPEMHMAFTFVATATGARFEVVTTFPSVEAMEKLLAMGLREGLAAALGQIDALLAELRVHSADIATALQIEDDTHVLITRDVNGPRALVWRAHNEAALIKRWMLGPPGWTMPECVVAAKVGDTYRYVWENAADGTRFGFTGELLELDTPTRSVSTERMLDTDGPATHNELVLTELPGARTRITLRITYPSRELRDIILGTGMVDGMEASYARLESEVLAG